MTWAIEQRAGGPRAKCVLWSIANYAGPLWFAYPKQDLIAEESEQSADSVQRYLAELVAAGLVRRVRLKRFGRRTHDFLILKPSPLFCASIEEILPHLPSGCDLLKEAEDAAADSGSVAKEENAPPQQDSESDAAADSGNVFSPTLPPPADDATAVQRQPIMEPVLNHSLPQTPSQADPPLVGEGETAAWQRFERFKLKYPIGVVDQKAAWLWFKPLSEVDQQAAIAAGPRYGRQCEKLQRRVRDAHRFLRDRVFDGFRESDPVPIDRKSREGRAITALYELAGKGNLLIGIMRSESGGIWYKKPITPQLLALGDIPQRNDPVALTAQQAAAWNHFIDEFLTVRHSVRLTEGSRAPYPWPPRKDGSISTGPPDTLMTQDDERDLAMLGKTG